MALPILIPERRPFDFPRVVVSWLGYPNVPTICASRVARGSRGRLALLVFPWAQFWLNQVAGQHQMVMHNGDHVTPALKLLWGPQTRGFPQQRLFVKAIPMLLPEAQSVSQINL